MGIMVYSLLWAYCRIYIINRMEPISNAIFNSTGGPLELLKVPVLVGDKEVLRRGWGPN